MHLHGELRKARSTKDVSLIYNWEKDITAEDRCAMGSPLRPHIVWFGEMVPMIMLATAEVMEADILIIIGTLLQVYPAAGLADEAPRKAERYYIDPNPDMIYNDARFKIIAEKATIGVPTLVKKLLA